MKATLKQLRKVSVRAGVACSDPPRASPTLARARPQLERLENGVGFAPSQLTGEIGQVPLVLDGPKPLWTSPPPCRRPAPSLRFFRRFRACRHSGGTK